MRYCARVAPGAGPAQPLSGEATGLVFSRGCWWKQQSGRLSASYAPCPSLRLYRVDIRVDREREHHEVFNALISERPVGNCVRMPAHRFLRVWRLGGGCGWAISGRTCLGSRGRFGQRRRRASTCPLDDLARTGVDNSAFLKAVEGGGYR